MSDKFYVGLNLTGFENNGSQRPISRITLRVDDEHVLTAGDDTGLELTADCPHATQSIVNSILARLKGGTYKMYSATAANLDPAAELGDGVTASGLYSEISRIFDSGTGFPSPSAPGKEELEDEYPAGGPLTQLIERKLAETRSRITKTATEILLEVERVEDGVAQMSASFSVQLQQITSRVQDAEGGISTLTQTASSLQSQITAANGNISSITQTVNSILSSVSSLEGEVSSIKQTANNISLSVSGSLGSTASIVLDVGGNKKTETLDLSNVRQSFANDTSAITISGGKVTFNSGTFVVNSENLQIDGNGNLTVKQGATIRGSSFYSETDATSVAITGGRMRLSYGDTLVGYMGTNQWISDNSKKGIEFDMETSGAYMAWAYRESSSSSQYTSKLLYTAKAMDSNAGTLEADRIYFDCYSHSAYPMSFGWDRSKSDGTIYGDGSALILVAGKELRLSVGATYGIDINSNYITLYQNSNRLVHCYNNLDMHNYSIQNTSDERLKKNIETSDVDALGVVNSIGTYSFDWVEDGRHEALGFIAQQLEAEASEDFVSVNASDGHYSTKDLKMIPYLVKAVQQLSAKVDELQGSTSATARRMVRKKQWEPTLYTLAEKEDYAESLQPDTRIPEPKTPEPIIFPD